MGIKQLEIQCPHCGYAYLPRSEESKRCPKCHKTLPQQIFKPMTKKQLFNTFIWWVSGGVAVLVVCVIFEAFTKTMAGIYLGLIGLLYFLTLSMPTYFEYRIYDLLHKQKSD